MQLNIISSNEKSQILNFKDEKKISIVLPCYNEEKTILDVINKIQKINFPNYEIIVVDDGSKDNSVEVLRGEPNVRVFIL